MAPQVGGEHAKVRKRLDGKAVEELTLTGDAVQADDRGRAAVAPFMEVKPHPLSSTRS